MLTKQELDVLKSKLPKNGYELIARKTDKTVAAITKIFNDPERYKKSVIDAAIEIIEEEKKSLEVQKAKIQGLAS